jgi:eukaryotic-like serine/threonine-protein kinase
MTLAAGTRLGAYEITGPLGSGGMGEVYRATDTTLEREVAIKVLPECLASDADRLARFEREAKTLASLGTTALVMELVEGSTLAERVAQRPIPAEEALGASWQVCRRWNAERLR